MKVKNDKVTLTSAEERAKAHRDSLRAFADGDPQEAARQALVRMQRPSKEFAEYLSGGTLTIDDKHQVVEMTEADPEPAEEGGEESGEESGEGSEEESGENAEESEESSEESEESNDAEPAGVH